ncbi:unnamed protein product, partial [marine sediment metagenome]
ASTPIEFEYTSGLTLTADLVKSSDDSASASGLSATELTNGKGLYRVSYTGAETGKHTLHVKQGTTVVAVYRYTLADTTAVHIPVPGSISNDTTTILARLDTLSSASGSGADGVTITVNVDGAPVSDMDVWVSSDENGSTVVAGTARTNSSGQVTLYLDAGSTYYLWGQKDGVNSIQGNSFVAVAD